ncbi:hypothetical protein [Facklamia miroungae]|uniref:Uncharacterized protein n=1 Tax=Facklamia miroungae TaxID=120956 RepID=A0A1G7P9A4_9LACT|nr:hypothetical protein [Facklamia miroungae]NKZ28628.1 hypothetical protein [Facklamia miroungae]SDF82858.1 hypothetical protein SAMN05421791_101169 [Facklamia miroungae]
MSEKPKYNKTPNRPTVWLLVFIILFSATMLLWLKGDAIQDFGQNLGVHSQTGEKEDPLVQKNTQERASSNKKEDKTVLPNEMAEETSLVEIIQEVQTIESTEVIETTESLEQAYAQLPAAKTYSIFQFENNEIQDRFVNRAFEVMIQRLIDEDNFYSAIDYQLTVYPTLDDNIYNLGLDEQYADQIIHRGHFRFDYRGKKVSKY